MKLIIIIIIVCAKCKYQIYSLKKIYIIINGFYNVYTCVCKVLLDKKNISIYIYV